MGCFAGVATWRFGSMRDDFGNFELTMQTQFEMLFGEFPEDWSESRDMQAYTVLYIMIMFLLIQNFLLAIIVEAYMKVRENIEELKIHQEVTHDVITCFQAYIVALYHGWPTPGKMGEVIGDWQAKLSVGFTEIYATGLFKNQAQVVKWVEFYGRFNFLEPEPVAKFGPDTQGSLEDKIESRVARVVGKELPLKQFAHETILSSKLPVVKTKSSKAPASGNGLGTFSIREIEAVESGVTAAADLVRLNPKTPAVSELEIEGAGVECLAQNNKDDRTPPSLREVSGQANLKVVEALRNEEVQKKLQSDSYKAEVSLVEIYEESARKDAAAEREREQRRLAGAQARTASDGQGPLLWGFEWPFAAVGGGNAH